MFFAKSTALAFESRPKERPEEFYQWPYFRKGLATEFANNNRIALSSLHSAHVQEIPSYFMIFLYGLVEMVALLKWHLLKEFDFIRKFQD